jgi:hypothetical protein
VQDGYPDGERVRNWMHEHFAAQPASTGIPTVCLSGAPEQRLTTAAHVVDQLLTQRFEL